MRANKNIGTYKGAIYENIVGDMLVKQGYNLYYYSSDKPSLEMDFFVRDADSLIPVEVKANDNATASLNKLLNEENIQTLNTVSNWDIRISDSMANSTPSHTS